VRRAALLALVACKIPGTLGLPCNEDAHCDAGQFCVDGTCQGEPAAGTSEGTDPSTSSSTTSMSTSSTTVPITTESSGSSSSSDSSSSTGPQCGRAIGTCDHLDVLFVVDNSGSMAEDIGLLLPAFTDFDAIAETFVEGFCSYHIGVTTTEVAPDFQPEECQVRGALSQSGALAGKQGCFAEDPEHPPFITEEDSITRVGCLLTVGQDYDDDEKQLETTIAALSPEMLAPGACNEGFLTEGAPLVVVIVSDEDDDDDSMTPGEDETRTGSVGDPTDWFDALTAIRPASNLGVILLGGTEEEACMWEPLSGNADGMGAEYPVRMLTFLQHFSGSGYVDHIESANICASAAELMMEFETFNEVLQAVCEDAV
jgi:hypothetical protein